ncbi:sulfatase [Actinokineospora xionganensis]|uniref:Sulfatase n=1 Tax=Actinokineospora xionganensis TaxID=2684470 RepID=A0ABR7LES4_9PSEU|nr:sulfatase [Actinokineospora xionganensis]MBC6451196.1 sulfatase [Actinokineospora xionganensis]
MELFAPLRRFGRGRVRRLATWGATALACGFVLFALLAPSDLDRLSPLAFLRVPVEGLLGVVLFIVLPTRARRGMAVLVGVALGLLTVVKIMDMGFDAVLHRPFDLVLDWPLLAPAVGYLDATAGPAGAVAAVVGAVVLALALLVLTTLSALRLTRLVTQHRLGAARAVAVLAVVWITAAIPGVRIDPDAPIASGSAAAFALDHARQVRAGLLDQDKFAAEAVVDRFRDTPGADLLTALRGKDVIVAFVESYGRDAVEDPELAPQVGAALDAGTRRLGAAGYGSRSAFLTSPTTGGGSWLAQATLLSGLWIDNQQRYRTLVSGDRLTLGGAFQRADWRSVGVVPGITYAWPEGAFFGYRSIQTAGDLGYHGPRFSYATMPDQYTLAAFERSERAKADEPLMAVIPLVSSHAPWTPTPALIDWADVGDGSIFKTMHTGDRPAEAIFTGDPTQIRADYRRSIEYSLNTLVSYVETYGDDDLVLVFLGDHQPAKIVTGEQATWDVPITIVTRDQAVLNRVAPWNWDAGLKPGSRAPVWPMDSFRDRFLTAFGP